MTYSDRVAVDIAAVKPDTITLTVDSLAAGDTVFDAFGGEHLIRSVRLMKDGTVRTLRGDGWFDYWLPGQTITFRKGAR